MYQLDADGTLTLKGVFDVPGLDGPSPISMPLAFSPDGTRLYAALRQPPFLVCSFGCDGGRPTPRLLGQTVVPGSLAYLAVAPGGAHLLGASGPEGRVISLRIDASGVADTVVHVADVPPRGHCVVPAPRGPYVYATSVGADLIIRYRHDPVTGHLEEPQKTSLLAGCHPRHLVFSADGHTLYCINEADATIVVLGVDDKNGDLELRHVVPTLPPGTPALAADIHPTPSGKLLYVSERNTNVITGLRVGNPGQTLRVVSRTPCEDWTRSFAIDSTGTFLLAPGQRSNRIAVFVIDSVTGRLGRIATQATGGNPSWVEVVPIPARAVDLPKPGAANTATPS